MGYDAYSYAVFGKEMHKSDLTVVTKKRSCVHDTNLNSKFCSECGKPVWVENKEFIADYGDGNKIGFFVSDHGQDNPEGILGFKLANARSSDTRMYEIPEPTTDMIQGIMDFFKLHNIEFDDKDLKSYLYTYHSY